MPAAHPTRLTALHPTWAIEGGRIDILGSDFPIDGPCLPEVRVGEVPARVVFASTTRVAALVPAGLEAGAVPVRIEGIAGETAFLEVGAPFATGLHQVDNPAFDRDGNLYVTYSGSRGERVPVSIFRVRRDGTREAFVSGIINPTSMVFDRAGDLYVSSRFEGQVYRIKPDGRTELAASDLGVACGLAFGAEGTLFVGDRSGTIFRLGPTGKALPFATLPASVAAFHLAFGPDGGLYVTAPTLSSYDRVYRIDSGGRVEVVYSGFGRPQGLAFDAQGALYVVEALAGGSGVYRLRADGAPEIVLAGPGLIGLAFDPVKGLVVTSNDTAYRLDAAVRAVDNRSVTP
jgi:sugar lactone lactonase YvrE